MRSQKPGKRGIALMTALLVAIFVFVLALSLLALDQAQNQFNVQAERSMRAYLAARSGLELYRVQSEFFTVGTAVTGKVPAPAGSGYVEVFSVTLEANGDIQSLGTLQDRTGKTLGTRLLIVPNGDMTNCYEPQ